MATQHYGIDLGGTKCALGMIDEISEFPKKKLKSFHQFPSSFQDALFPLEKESSRDLWMNYLADQIVERLKLDCHSFDQLKIGMGSPGKFVNGKLTPGTTPQFGSSLDHYPLEEELRERLEKALQTNLDLTIQNDALAQFAYGIRFFESMGSLKSSDNGLRIGYIGPGTGLGGGFAELKNSQIHFHTDGHIGDLQLSTGELAEEDLISGMAIKRLFRLSGADLAANFEEHKPKLRQLGNNLSKLIEAFCSGNYQKTRPSTQWSVQDKEWVKEVRCFLLGGSILTKEPISSFIVNACQLKLQEKGLSEVELYSLPGISAEAAVIGASLLSESIQAL